MGSLLLKEVERIAAENGVTKIVLETVKFRPLTLTEGLLRLRETEVGKGLPIDARVMMRRELEEQ